MLKLDEEFTENSFYCIFHKIKFEDFLYIENFLELHDLLVDFKDNKDMGSTYRIVDYNMYYKCDTKRLKYDLFNRFYSKLGGINFIAHPSIIDIGKFFSIYSIIMFSCVNLYRCELSKESLNTLIYSDLVPKISLGLDNYDDVQDCYLDDDFIKKLHDIQFEDRANTLFTAIEKYWNKCDEFNNYTFFNEFKYASLYLAACYAIKNDRNITPEDVTNGWLLCLKLFLTDFRPYLFNECTDEEIDRWILNKNKVSKFKFFIYKLFCIAISVCLFLIIITIIGSVMLNINFFGIGRFIGLLLLGLITFFVVKFYHMILEFY